MREMGLKFVGVNRFNVFGNYIKQISYRYDHLNVQISFATFSRSYLAWQIMTSVPMLAIFYFFMFDKFSVFSNKNIARGKPSFADFSM